MLTRRLENWRSCGVLQMALLAVAVGTLWSARAQAEDGLAHGDRTATLYREVLRVGEDGRPLLPLSVLGRLEKLEVSAPSGLRILGTGDGQVDVRLPPGRSVEVVAAEHKAGVYSYFVVLHRAPSWDFDTLRAAKQRWKDLGVALATKNSGTSYSLAGRMFDTRQTLLCLEQSFATDADAQKKAKEIVQQFSEALAGQEPTVHPVVETLPSAALVVRDRGGSAVEVHARDVLWFEALQPAGQAATLQVVGTRKGARTDLELPGRIYVVAGQHGLEVVNEAQIERLLEGVVASEIFHSAPDAALRAQAVAARTDMLAKVGTRHATDPYAICSEVHCQAFRGLERVSPRIAQAVRDTRGVVMVDSDGRLVDAYYHAVSGGHTESNENAWPGRPQPALRGRPDVVRGTHPFAGGVTEAAVSQLLEGKDESWAASSGLNAEACRWRTERSAAELQEQLKRFGFAGPVVGLDVIKRGVSGRIISLAVRGPGEMRKIIDGELRIRSALGGSYGPKGLRSSLVLIKPGPAGRDGAPQSWTFVGAGFGHGVGMDQTGAVARAKAGQDYREILLHYYAGAKLEQLY